MDPGEYDRMFAAEDRHFWFRGRRAWIEAVLDRDVGPRAGPILDDGCGTGGNLALLARRGAAFGVDSHPEALGHCRQRGLGDRVCAGSANALPFADERFALVCLLDVLYHREIDTARALGEAHRVLAPGGHLLVTEPALPILAGPHDRAVWGDRRFTRASLRALIEPAGFEVVRLSYANCLLFPLVVGRRALDRVLGSAGSNVGTTLPPANEVLFRVLRMEAALLAAGWSLPWGSSLVCLARRVA